MAGTLSAENCAVAEQRKAAPQSREIDPVGLGSTASPAPGGLWLFHIFRSSDPVSCAIATTETEMARQKNRKPPPTT